MLQHERMSIVTADGGIMKLLMKEGSATVGDWRKGANARFHYRTFTYRKGEEHAHRHGQCSHAHDQDHEQSQDPTGHEHAPHVHSDACSHAHKETDTDRPIRVKVVDTRDVDEPFELRIGMGFQITMFEECVKTMRLGEVSRFLVLPAHFEGYPEMEKTLREERKRIASGGSYVPPSCCSHAASMNTEENMDLVGLEASPLELEIEFLELLQPGAFEREAWEMSNEEKYAEVPAIKDDGGRLYKQGKFEAASERYKRAIILLESITTGAYMVEAEREMSRVKDLQKATFESYAGEFIQPRVVLELLQACRLNYAACRLKTHDYHGVVSQCSEVLSLDPTNVKALFRRAQAYLRLGRDLELAESDLNKLKALELPAELRDSLAADLKREEALLAQKKTMHSEKEKQMYSNLFLA